jgi:hypothetical protein
MGQLVRDKMPAALALRIQPARVNSDTYAVNGRCGVVSCKARIDRERNTLKRDLECAL